MRQISVGLILNPNSPRVRNNRNDHLLTGITDLVSAEARHTEYGDWWASSQHVIIGNINVLMLKHFMNL